MVCTLLLLSAHRLLNDVVDLVAVRFVEHWRVVRIAAVSMMVMVCGCPVKRALRVRHLDIVVIADHLTVVRAQSVLVLVMVLVELYHGELLLKRACALLLHHDAMLHVLVIAALVLAGGLNHMSIICTVLLDVGLVARRRVCQCHGPLLLAIRVASIDIAVAVTVDNLVPVNENQVRRMRLFYTF